MREKQQQCGTSLISFKSFMALGRESSVAAGQKVERCFKRICSERVRCRSLPALKISHLWSITACFNPHSLSENSKWCSKPFHHCGTNHMLSFILDFLHLFFLFCSGPADKSNTETLNSSGLSVHYMLDRFFQSDLVRSVIYEFAVLCGWTSEWLPCRKPVNHVSVFICTLQTEQHKFTAKSACLHMFWLRCKSKLSVYHLFVHACSAGDVGYLLQWVVYDIPTEQERVMQSTLASTHFGTKKCLWGKKKGNSFSCFKYNYSIILTDLCA